jgi:hypothetical protein
MLTRLRASAHTVVMWMGWSQGTSTSQLHVVLALANADSDARQGMAAELVPSKVCCFTTSAVATGFACNRTCRIAALLPCPVVPTVPSSCTGHLMCMPSCLSLCTIKHVLNSPPICLRSSNTLQRIVFICNPCTGVHRVRLRLGHGEDSMNCTHNDQ